MCVSKVIWFNTLLENLGFYQDEPIIFFCDKSLALDLSKNSVKHDKTKILSIFM